MAVQKPLVLPDVFTGDKNWEEWIDHFDSVATVNGWDDAAKLQWLRVRMTGRAATTFRRLPEETRADFALSVAALQKRFEPESKKELYMAELQTRTKKRKEDWTVFGEELKRLADKAYPDLQNEARERLALNQYLSRLEDPQLAFSVRQNKPTDVDSAIRITLEMESYMQASKACEPVQIAHVEEEDGEEPVAAAPTAAGKTKDDPLQILLERMDQLEKGLKSVNQERPYRNQERPYRNQERPYRNQERPYRSASGGSNRQPPRTKICWNCRGEGHIAPNCPSPKQERQQQGNDQPSGQ